MIHIGNLIRYYRKEKQLSQQQLCENICTEIELSRIERGSSDASDELVTLILQKLNISIVEEAAKQQKLEQELESLYNAILHLNVPLSKDLIGRLESRDFQSFHHLEIRFLLLKSRFFLLESVGEYNLAKEILERISEDSYLQLLPPFEKNMYHHMWIIFGIRNLYMQIAIEHMEKIDLQSYYQTDVYFHLSIVYFFKQSYVQSFKMLEKAKKYYDDQHNLGRLLYVKYIECLNLLYTTTKENEFNKEIHQAIILCDTLENEEVKRKLLYLLALFYYRGRHYSKAVSHFNTLLSLEPTHTMNYSRYLFTSLLNIFEGQLVENEAFIEMVIEHEDVLKRTEHIFGEDVRSFYLASDPDAFFHFVEQTMLPIAVKKNNKENISKYLQILLDFYLDTNQENKLFSLTKNYRSYLITYEQPFQQYKEGATKK